MFCRNCGIEMPEEQKFCSNCGSPAAGASGAPVFINVIKTGPYGNVCEHADIRGRYKLKHLLLGGYVGLIGLILILSSLIVLFTTGIETLSAALLLCAIGAAIAFASFLPGFLHISKNTPEDEVVRTCVAYVFKCVSFFFLWGISIVACLYIIGLVFKAWRIGLNASRPNASHYTLFQDGKKTTVTRMEDAEMSTFDRTRYIYMDANGKYYRTTYRN